MSYAFRSEKRKKAHLILKELTDVFLKEALKENVAYDAYMNMMESVAFEDTSEKDGVLYLSVINILYANEHIYASPRDGSKNIARISPKGLEAYYEGYYIIENRKDYLENIELKTKWILPFIPIIISSIALAFSILAYFNPKK